MLWWDWKGRESKEFEALPGRDGLVDRPLALPDPDADLDLGAPSFVSGLR